MLLFALVKRTLLTNFKKRLNVKKDKKTVKK